MPNETTQFDSESARLAGIKSGAARRPLDKDKDARQMYAYLANCADLLACQLFTAPCPHCKRQGPTDLRSINELARSLQTISELILFYAWGRPGTESSSNRAGATVEDYKRAQREVQREDLESYAPDDLPDAPTSESDALKDNTNAQA